MSGEGSALPAEVTCCELNRVLADYVDGQIGPETRAAFEAHLTACPVCVAYLRSYAATIRLARDAGRASGSIPQETLESLVRAVLAARGDRGR